MVKNVQDKNAQTRTVGYRTRFVPAGDHGSINIGVYDWPTTDVFWLPSENLINNSFMCTKIKKINMDNIFSLDACSGPM